MVDDPDPTAETENAAPPSRNDSIPERMVRLEVALEVAAKRIEELESPIPLWKDRRFLSGLVALPALILSGWILTLLNSAILQSSFFQPLPFIHTALGTEEAIKAYVAPHKTKRGEVAEEITSLLEGAFVSHSDLEEMDFVSSEELRLRGFLNRHGLRDAATEGEIDDRIRQIGGRRQNFNDFFVQNLGLNGDGLIETDCTDVPEGAEILEFNTSDNATCFFVRDAFTFSDSFTILRPQDVTSLVFEIFVVSRKVTAVDNDEMVRVPLPIPEDIRHQFFEIRVNANKVDMVSEGIESNFESGVFAYKYEGNFALDAQMEDRTYDILTVSLNLIEYDHLFQSERRDKSFMIFVVPRFENS